MGRIDSSGTLVAWGDEDALVGRIASTGRRARITSAFRRCMRIRANRRSIGPNIDLIQRLAPLAL